MNEQNNGDKVKMHSGWLAVLLSFLIPGAGQFFTGRKRSGLLWFIFFFIIEFVFYWLVITPKLNTLMPAISLFVIIIILWIFMLTNSCKPFPRKSKWFWISVVIFLFLLSSIDDMIMLKSMGAIETYKIPANSMSPTIQSGDHLIAQMNCYKMEKPQRGDIVVFETEGIEGISAKKKHFVKRIAALPGEKISIKKGKLFIDDNVASDPSYFNRIKYYIGNSSYLKNDNKSYIVPEDHYFVLGDNSKNSNDSRYWGPLPEKNILGKVTKIYWPLKRSGIPKYEKTYN